MCHEAAVRLACEDASATWARRFVVDRLREWGLSHQDPAFDVLDAAALAVGELAANAARFCADYFNIDLLVHHDAVEINVSDGNEARPAVRPASLLATTGRGLALVAGVSDEWGVDLRAGGKTVWCRLPVREGSALAVGCARLPAGRGTSDRTSGRP